MSESTAGPWTPFAKATAPRQCCDVQWCGDTVIAATYDYIEDEGLRRGGLCLTHADQWFHTALSILFGPTLMFEIPTARSSPAAPPPLRRE